MADIGKPPASTNRQSLEEENNGTEYQINKSIALYISHEQHAEKYLKRCSLSLSIPFRGNFPQQMVLKEIRLLPPRKGS
jgi:hypothetical protein